MPPSTRALAGRFLRHDRQRAAKAGTAAQAVEYSATELAALLHEALGQKCPYCGVTVLDHGSITVDHRTPIARGGRLEIRNLIAVCKRCNAAKGILLADEWLALVRVLEQMSAKSKSDVEARLLGRGAKGWRR